MKKNLLTTQTVVAIGIGSALYAALSYIQIPIGPNTSLRVAIAILAIIAAYYGPIAGFSVGFIGHALNDALMYGSVWWSWVFLSAILGLVIGLIFLDKDFSIKEGSVENQHIVKMLVLTVVGLVVASLFAYVGDVFFYGEPADKVWLQIIIASISNAAVLVILGIPAIILLAKNNKKHTGLEN
ncbi:MAG: ECF-type riboflavin transporter substrate-binding protein [Lactovum sp.]